MSRANAVSVTAATLVMWKTAIPLALEKNSRMSTLSVQGKHIPAPLLMILNKLRLHPDLTPGYRLLLL